MTTLDAYLTREDQLCLAIKAVRKILPLPQKMVMAKPCPDFAGELVCATILLPAIGNLQHFKLHNLEERIQKALTEASACISALGPEYQELNGLDISTAITNIAVALL